MLRFIKWLFGLVAITLLIVVWMNTIDSDLSPTAVEWLEAPPPAPPINENGFYLLRGIDAPPDADAYELGRARVAASRECERQALKNADWEALASCNTPALPLPQFADLRGQCGNGSQLLLCIVQAANVSSWQRAIDVPSHVSARIDHLLTLDRFYVPAEDVSTPSVSFSQIDVTRLQVARAAVSFANNDPNTAINHLFALEKWARSLLRESASFLEHSLAIASMAITVHAQDALELAARKQGRQIKFDYRLLSDEELDWSRAIQGEARYAAYLLKEKEWANYSNFDSVWGRLSHWATEKFTLPNNMTNDTVSQAQTRLTYFSAPRAQYLERRQEALNNAPKAFSIGDLRDLLGYSMANLIPEESYASYSDELRMIDLQLWLLSIRRSLWEADIAPESVTSALSDLGPAPHDPYFGNTVRWDSKEQQLIIDVPAGIEAARYLSADYVLATENGQ